MLKLFKNSKGKDFSRNNVILHNVYILYLLFIIALINFLTLVYSNDYYSASIFVLVGFLTSFFSKNMVVILFIAIAMTNIIKYGKKAGNEAFTTATPTPSSTSESKKTKTKTKEPAETVEDESADLSVEQNPDVKKEEFSQDSVYTTDEDREISKTEKMILTQEKLLKSMNRYKPLLDTLQGITKNMAVVKGVASFSDE